ncbi:MAG TPA: hypothetical protein VFA18_07095, partial [Gemmataceae bacterium]|nr:hypothetical protein [Gemmataceae bacterium]
MSQASVDMDQSAEVLLGQVADEFTERLKRGEHPAIEDYAERHPEIAELLRQVLPALMVMRSSAGDGTVRGDAATADADLTGVLGDFRIVREVGRGG